MTNALKHAPIDADDIRFARRKLWERWTLSEIGDELGLDAADLDLALWRWMGRKA